MPDALRKEIVGVGLLGLFLFTLVSLLSYHPFDPSFNADVSSDTVRNFCGRAGSYTADFLFQMFGLMSYGVCAVIATFSALSIRKKAVDQPLLFASGVVLLFLSLSALLQITCGRVQIKSVIIPFSGLTGAPRAGVSPHLTTSAASSSRSCSFSYPSSLSSASPSSPWWERASRG
jgi:S-DNA-T family DNA segregation ATPase FtsK/SpoIIIE